MTRLNLTPDDINWYFPIYGVTAHGRVLILHRACRFQPPKGAKKGNRKQIYSVSKKSLDLLCYKVMTCGISFRSMITLTYGQNWPLNGRRVKADVNHFLTVIKRSLGNFSYYWFLEFQKRGAPHIHLVWTIPPPDECNRELVATIWADIAEDGNWAYTEIRTPFGKKNAFFGMNTKDDVFRQHRRSDVWEGIRKQDGAIRYALMYAKKEAQKKVPVGYRDVGRFWSTSRDVKPPKGIEVPMREIEVRQLLAKLQRDFDSWQVLPKIIFLPTNLTD